MMHGFISQHNDLDSKNSLYEKCFSHFLYLISYKCLCSKPYTALLWVRMMQSFDHINNHEFYTISPEIGCEEAQFLYLLVSFDGRKSAINWPAGYVFEE
jgi:hypothetical protein